MINPLVGGGLLSDGLGLGDRVDARWPRILTAVGIAAGIVLAYATFGLGTALEGIVLAQSSTILAVPLCAIVLVVLANDHRAVGEYRNGWRSNVVAGAAIVVLLVMSVVRLMAFVDASAGLR